MIDLNNDELLSIAKEAAIKAGDHLLANFNTASKINKEIDHDIKLQADVESEKIIIDFLNSKTDYSILSEECGELEGGDESLTWIIDPVDGTYNYLRQIPLCCVSIALWKGKEPLLGVIYDFNRNEMFTGIHNEKAWLNDERVSVAKIKEKARALMCSGLPNRTDFSTESLSTLVDNLQDYKKVRFLGTAALMMAYVACGRADIYYEDDIMLWDVAAGIPIVTGAGGTYSIEETNIKHCLNVVVSSGAFDE